MWFYVSSPDQTLRYIAVISKAKAVGQIEHEDGIGNAEFNSGLLDYKYAYEIMSLFQLKRPMHIAELKEKFGLSPPQRYAFLKDDFLELFPMKDQVLLF